MTDWLDETTDRLRAFAADRDWERFHTPKNLVMALGVEVAELAETFQWLSPDESLSAASDALSRDAIEKELADIAIYLLRLADVLDVDLREAVARKIEDNARRYPPTEFRGSARKAPH